jgi:hypothetical protein
MAKAATATAAAPIRHVLRRMAPSPLVVLIVVIFRRPRTESNRRNNLERPSENRANACIALPYIVRSRMLRSEGLTPVFNVDINVYSADSKIPL